MAVAKLHNVLVFAMLAALVVGCAGRLTPARDPTAGSQGAAPAAPKRIRAAIQGEPWTLSRTAQGNVGRVRGVNELEMLIHAGLAAEDDGGTLQPRLAQAVPGLESGLWRVFPDGRMETTWRLRPGLAWHDGAPLTPADLLFTVHVGEDPELTNFHHPGFEAVDGIEQTAPDAVTVRWNRPYFDADFMFNSRASFAMPLPRHLLEAPYESERATFLDHPYWTSEFVGLGPFRVREFARSSYVVLEAFPGYALGRPKVDEVEVRFIVDLSALLAHVLAGEVDLTIGRALSVEQAVSFRERWLQGTVLVEPGSSWAALYPQHVNPSPAVIGDARFRRALVHALDRQELVDVLLHGLVTVAHSNIGPHRPEFRDVESAIVRYDYDPRRAAQIVEGLGYVRAADGQFRDGAGQPLVIELRSTGGDDFRDKEVLAIADNWRRNGIGTDVVFIPRQRASDREYRVTKPGFELVSQGTEPRDLSALHSRAIPTPETRWVGTNRGRYSNAELDGLLDRFFLTIPKRERNAVLAEIVRHISDQAVVMGVYHSADSLAVAARVKNVTGSDPWNAHLWDVN